MQVLEAILKRHSYRGTYKPDPIPREDLKIIMKAGLAAPSGNNKQTTSLIAVDDKEILDQLFSVIDPTVFERAPAMICVLTRKIKAYKDRCVNIQDYSAAMENMLLAICDLGYQTCWNEFRITDKDKIGSRLAKILGVSKEYELVCMLPIGKGETEPEIPEKMKFEDRAWFNGFFPPVKEEKTLKKKNILDQNGDGKFDEKDVMILLDKLYGTVCDGIPGMFKSVEESVSDYIIKEKSVDYAAKRIINDTVTICTTSGFLTSLGGVITLPVTVPANVASVICMQLRMIAMLAHLGGFDVKSDTVQALIYACLAGVSVGEVVKKAGIAAGNKVTVNLIKKIPGTALVKINQKVGFRFVTKFGEKGIVNLGKVVPVVGGVIGGGIDFFETRGIGKRAVKEFINYDFEDSSDVKNNH